MMSTPARRRRSSGILVMPDRRMSCSVMIDVEFGRVEGALRGLRRGDDRLLEHLLRLQPGLGAARELAGFASRLHAAARPRGAASGLGARPRARRPSAGLRARAGTGGAGTARRHRLLRLGQLRLLLADARLERGDDLRDLVAVLRVPLEVLLVIGDRVLQVALVDVRARDVVEDVRVRKDVVRLLQLLDAEVVLAVRDLGHALLEVGTGLRALVGARAAGREDDGAQEEPGGHPCEVSLRHVFELHRLSRKRCGEEVVKPARAVGISEARTTVRASDAASSTPAPLPRG